MLLKQSLLKFFGDSVGARARRTAVLSYVDFGGSQILRLASNLLLTRLLFPEAFGLMAIISVITSGLSLFSDTGIRSVIIQSQRGDDPDFLNTAWTVQVLRGLLLWVIAILASSPASIFYDEPSLVQLLPVASVVLFIDGFKATSVHTANRHLTLGRLTTIRLTAQILSILVTAFFAWLFESVWALILGSLSTSLITVAGFRLFIPGIQNKFHIDASSLKEITRFGKWIFLSTAASFVVYEGDRAILAYFVSLETLGIYNIAYFFATAPILLTRAVQQSLIVPLYRIIPPKDDPANQDRIFRARRMVAVTMILVASLLSVVGPALINILYDPRYAAAGAMITLYSISVVPMISLNSIGAALIGFGDTRAMFFVLGTTAIIQTTLLLIAVPVMGIGGALLAPGVAIILSYPIRFYYSRKYSVFDPLMDLGLTSLGLIVTAAGCLMHYEKIFAVLGSHQ